MQTVQTNIFAGPVNNLSPLQVSRKKNIELIGRGSHFCKSLFYSITLQNSSWNEISQNIPDSKIRRANMGPIWGRQDPGGSHVGPMNFAI